MKRFVRNVYYLITGKETRFDMEYDGKQYNWKKLRLPVKRSDIMKRLFMVALFAVFLPTMVYASPFIVCDSYPSTGVQPDNFKVVLDGTSSNSAPQTVADGVRLHFDVGSVAVGNHTMTVQACKTYPADEWHPNPTEACSTTVPFSFSRPASPASPGVPASIKLNSN